MIEGHLSLWPTYVSAKPVRLEWSLHAYLFCRRQCRPDRTCQKLEDIAIVLFGPQYEFVSHVVSLEPLFFEALYDCFEKSGVLKNLPRNLLKPPTVKNRHHSR